jgi:hypothetical protein
MNALRVLAAAAGLSICLGLLVIPDIGGVRAQSSAAPADIDALRAEVETLKRQAPDQAHVMADVDYHFSSLWFAGRNANWPLAAFYLGEVRAHLNWAVRVRPVRKLASGADLELRPILQGVEGSGLADVEGAIEKHDRRVFELAYRRTMGQCYACHQAAEKPYLRLRIPETPGARMIDPRPGRDGG